MIPAIFRDPGFASNFSRYHKRPANLKTLIMMIPTQVLELKTNIYSILA